MEILLNVLFLAIGFVLLIKGADCFVDGAAAAAKLMKIPTLVIGLTVVAFGTSAPELAVSLAAAIKGSNSIALGNVVGSNMLNFYLILGISAIITPLAAKKVVLVRDYTISLIAAALVLVLGLIGMGLGRIDGIILTICVISYVIFLIISSKKSGGEGGEDFETMPPLKCVLFILLGLAGVVVGGQLVVTGAQTIAKFLGMSEALIALTVVALGTSLPELVTSVMAAKKGETDLALGNVLGSNIFNLLFILGVSSAIRPMVPDGVTEIVEYRETLLDLGIFLIASVIFFFPIWKNKRFTRPIGIALVLFYAAYFAFIMMRNYGVINIF